MFYIIAGIIILLLGELALYWLAYHENKAIFFSVCGLIFASAIIAINWESVATFLGIHLKYVLLLIALYVVERTACTIALYKAAGEDNLVWYYLIFNVPIVGWLVYWAVKIR